MRDLRIDGSFELKKIRDKNPTKLIENKYFHLAVYLRENCYQIVIDVSIFFSVIYISFGFCFIKLLHHSCKIFFLVFFMWKFVSIAYHYFVFAVVFQIDYII